MSVFSKDGFISAVKFISNPVAKERLVEDALSNKAVVDCIMKMVLEKLLA